MSNSSGLNRTPFKKGTEIATSLLASDKVEWEDMQGNKVVLTTDGRHYGLSAQRIHWTSTPEYPFFRPYAMSWEEAEKLAS